jgi:hypothetical protein
MDIIGIHSACVFTWAHAICAASTSLARRCSNSSIKGECRAWEAAAEGAGSSGGEAVVVVLLVLACCCCCAWFAGHGVVPRCVAADAATARCSCCCCRAGSCAAPNRALAGSSNRVLNPLWEKQENAALLLLLRASLLAARCILLKTRNRSGRVAARCFSSKVA